MHPDTSVLCNPSKNEEHRNAFFSGFNFCGYFSLRGAEETRISCLGKNLRNYCLKSPIPSWHRRRQCGPDTEMQLVINSADRQTQHPHEL